MNKVNEQIKTAIVLVSTIQGTLNYLKGLTWKRFDFWIKRAAEMNMTTEEMIKEIAKDFLGVNLTVQQCSVVDSILGLRSVVTSYHDAAIIESFELAINKDPIGMATTIKQLMYSARHNVAMEIVHDWKNQCTNDKEFSLEKRVAAYMEFGISKQEADGYAHMSGTPVDFYGLAGVDANTFELY